MDKNGTRAGLAAVLLGALALGGCGSTSDGSPSIGTMLITGTANPNPPASPSVGSMLMAGTANPSPVRVGDPFCPRVTVLEGGALLQARGSVVSFGELARECTQGPNGTTIVKVGAEGRVVLGSSGAGGRFDVPVRFVVSDGAGNVIASRVQRASVAVPAGQGNALFAVVEEGIVVPEAAAETFAIEVGLGGAPAATGRWRG